MRKPGARERVSGTAPGGHLSVCSEESEKESEKGPLSLSHLCTIAAAPSCRNVSTSAAPPAALARAWTACAREGVSEAADEGEGRRVSSAAPSQAPPGQSRNGGGPGGAAEGRRERRGRRARVAIHSPLTIYPFSVQAEPDVAAFGDRGDRQDSSRGGRGEGLGGGGRAARKRERERERGGGSAASRACRDKSGRCGRKRRGKSESPEMSGL